MIKIANIIKHTHATEICVATKVEADYVSATITDNGQGFLLAQAPNRGGNGLSNQMRCAESIGAEISFVSDDAGTRLTLRLPIKRKPASNWRTVQLLLSFFVQEMKGEVSIKLDAERNLRVAVSSKSYDLFGSLLPDSTVCIQAIENHVHTDRGNKINLGKSDSLC